MRRDIRLLRELSSGSADRGREFAAYLLSDGYSASDDPRILAQERAVISWRDETPMPNDEREVIISLESACMGVLARMEGRGVAFDHTKLESLGNELEKKIRQSEEAIYEVTGERFNVNSVKQVQEILYERLNLPKGKKIKTGHSVDNETLSELSGSHAIAGMILEHRSMSKLLGTYVE